MWLAVEVSTTLDDVFGIPTVAAPEPWMLSLGYSLVLFVLWDLSRFITHLALHKNSVLWAFHQVHHSGEVLTRSPSTARTRLRASCTASEAW